MRGISKRGNFSFSRFFRGTQKKGEFGFVWLFAIIAGVAILLLVIYAAVSAVETIRSETDASIAKKLTILTDPLEAGFTSATFGTIKFAQVTKIRNLCSDIGFGENSIAASSKSGVGKDFLENYGPSTSIKQKYVFGLEEDIGNTYYILSKSFNFPFKVSDFVVMISDNKSYCFVDAPRIVREELESLKIPIIFFENCSKNSNFVRVCFDDSRCEISVVGNCESCSDRFETGTVNRGGDVVSYAGSLIYPAIFSDKYLYECNVHRLLYRAGVVSKVLARKAALMNARLGDCNTNFEPILKGWSGFLENASISDMVQRYPESIEMNEAKRWEVCSVW